MFTRIFLISIQLETVEKVTTFSYTPRHVVSSHEGVCSVMHLSRERVFSRVEWRLGISNTGTRSLHVSGSNDIIPTQGCSWWCADDFCRRNSSRRSSVLLVTARNNRGILFKRSLFRLVFLSFFPFFYFFLYLFLVSVFTRVIITSSHLCWLLASLSLSLSAWILRRWTMKRLRNTRRKERRSKRNGLKNHLTLDS